MDTLLLLLAAVSAGPETPGLPANLGIVQTDIGCMGQGTKPFRSGLVHSSGDVILGTYGPQPALLWRYEPGSGKLLALGAPGEYQLDSMVEAPDGSVYVGTAYGGLIYRLEPASGQITSLGSPPIDSTSWIFALSLASDGHIYGAKGVGLFRLDPSQDTITSLGLVEGDHTTPGPNASAPIVRNLVQTPDGTIWGDTNRWLFRYHIDRSETELVADMAIIDPATYAIFLAGGDLPSNDCWFALYSRFSGKQVSATMWVVRQGEREPRPVDIRGLKGTASGSPMWWRDEAGRPLLLVATWEEEAGRSHVYTVDPDKAEVLWEWAKEPNEGGFLLLTKDTRFYLATPRRLLQSEFASRRLVEVATNPTPAECRCLAISEGRKLGTDTYDLGYAFTRDLQAGVIRDHGKVWTDDHRCNYGPAAFAGHGRYLLANHGEALPRLWVTDVETNRHWPIGHAATQLIALADGSVWGIEGDNPPGYAFSPDQHWTAAWRTRPGQLFRHTPGAETVERFDHVPLLGPIAPHPIDTRALVGAAGRQLWTIDAQAVARSIAETRTEISGMVTHRGTTYVLLGDGSLARLDFDAHGSAGLAELATGFGLAERGLFTLSRSGWVVGVSGDGAVSVYDPISGQLRRIHGPPPAPAGPAVDPAEDAWYFAHDTVQRYELKAEAAYQSPGVSDRLPVMYEAMLRRLDFPLSWTAAKHQDFAAWRDQARRTVMEAILAPPPAAPFDPLVIAEEDRGDYTARKIVLNITADSRVSAYMTIPKGSGPFPAVLLLHDHGARFDIGKEKLIRPLAVDSSRLDSARQWVAALYGGRWLGDELARRGYVCFCTDALNWSERGGAGFDGQQYLAANLLHLGSSFAGLIAQEDLRAAEFLAGYPHVDRSRVAAMGLSMGAFRTWQVAALSEHIEAAVAVCWMATVKGLMVPGNNQTTGQSAFALVHPGLVRYLDYPDVASIACPKPLLVYAGEHDTLFPVPAVTAAFSKLHEVWTSQGMAKRLETRLWPVGHVFDREMQDTAFEWLSTQFQEVRVNGTEGRK